MKTASAEDPVEPSMEVASNEAFMKSSVETSSELGSTETFMEASTEATSMEASRVETSGRNVSVEASVEAPEASTGVYVEFSVEASGSFHGSFCGIFHESFRGFSRKITIAQETALAGLMTLFF